MTDPDTKDEFISLTVEKGGAAVFDPRKTRASPDIVVQGLDKTLIDDATVVEELKFVPYYFRANRGGRGQMRVGVRRWHH